MPMAQRRLGISGELQGECRCEQCGVAAAGIPLCHVSGVDDRIDSEPFGAGRSLCVHVRREFQAFDFVAHFEQRKHQSSGARADFQCRAWMHFEKIRHQGQLGLIVLSFPEGIVEFGFE